VLKSYLEGNITRKLGEKMDYNKIAKRISKWTGGRKKLVKILQALLHLCSEDFHTAFELEKELLWQLIWLIKFGGISDSKLEEAVTCLIEFQDQKYDHLHHLS
jgi:hypothetical protein